MPEFTWSPELGDAIQTRGGRPVYEESSSSDSAFTEEKGFGTLEDYQDSQLNRTARELGRREALANHQRGTTDEDLDAGSYNVELANLEALLQTKQQELFATRNPAVAVALARECEQLAEQIVSGRNIEGSLGADDIDPLEDNSFEAQVKAELGDHVNEILANAGEVLSPQSSEEFNDLLSSDDELAKKATFNTLKSLREHPEAFVTDKASYNAFNQDTVSRITELVGPQVGDQITTLNAALVAGHTTPAQVMKLASRSPHLLRGLMECARAGVIKIAL